MSTPNASMIFNSIPSGKPIIGETLKKVEGKIDLNVELPSGSILVKTISLSYDPYLRGRMRPVDVPSYAPAFPLGQPITNFGVSEIIKSNNHSLKIGQHVYGFHEFSEYSIIDGEAAKGLKVLENKENLPWTNWVASAGMPGQTAWYGLRAIAKPVKGETIFISGASGPVGQMVIALCHRAGLKVVASAGSDEKVAFLKDILKVEVAFNYKTTSTAEVLAKNPFEIYWDHVGGETLGDVLGAIKPGGRIVACGAISGYNGEDVAVKNTMMIVGKFLLIQGFIVLHHDISAFYDEIPQLIASGEIHPPKEHIVKGLDNGEAFLDLLEGGNFGKSVISFE